MNLGEHVQREGVREQHLNVNTYVSVGLLLILLTGFGWLIKGQSDGKQEIVISKLELTAQIKDLGSRVNNLETTKNSWTSTDMFQWAVHLQQSNPNLKVPEPQINTK